MQLFNLTYYECMYIFLTTKKINKNANTEYLTIGFSKIQRFYIPIPESFQSIPFRIPLLLTGMHSRKSKYSGTFSGKIIFSSQFPDPESIQVYYTKKLLNSVFVKSNNFIGLLKDKRKIDHMNISVCPFMSLSLKKKFWKSR